MSAIAINGSPRKHWNTGKLLEKALEGAAEKGADTEMIQLYDLNFRGCVSCFSCKLKNGTSYGRCAMKDSLIPVLAKVAKAKALFLGSPIYLGTETGEMRSFLERLVFPNLSYTNPPSSLFQGQLRVGLIFTFGATEEQAIQMGFDKHIAKTQMLIQRIFGHSETLCSYDTLQFDNYDNYVAPRFNPAEKIARHEEVFPGELKQAFNLGSRLFSAS
ncbi:MAG: flavodoxin family protein [Candidatus Riflebacteria bacterium]|nr:flavodoxin family protein [Candidatus Riflebacteria bacterium]